jgi:hypothetical protein
MIVVCGTGAGGGGSLVGTDGGRRVWRGAGNGVTPLSGIAAISDATRVPCASQSDSPSPPAIT